MRGNTQHISCYVFAKRKITKRETLNKTISWNENVAKKENFRLTRFFFRNFQIPFFCSIECKFWFNCYLHSSVFSLK